MVLINVEVKKVTREAYGIRSFLLAKKGLFRLPAYTPGCISMCTVARGSTGSIHSAAIRQTGGIW